MSHRFYQSGLQQSIEPRVQAPRLFSHRRYQWVKSQRVNTIGADPISSSAKYAELTKTSRANFGDYCQLFEHFCGAVSRLEDEECYWSDHDDPAIHEIRHDILVRTQSLEEALTIRAEQHAGQGQFRDAEYLYRKLYTNLDPNEYYGPRLSQEDTTNLVTIYQKLGDLPSAEIIQEILVLRLSRRQNNPVTALLREAEQLTDMHIGFRRRAEKLDHRFAMAADITIASRIAILDIPALNTLAYDSGLLTKLNGGKCSALHVAVLHGAKNLARMLLMRGANVEDKTDKGTTPLLVAAYHRKEDMAKLLLDYGANVKATDVIGSTALHMAAGRSSLNVTKLLLEYGANIQAIDKSGQTALHKAAEHDDGLEVVSLLINAKIDVEASDDDGQTALDLAFGSRACKVARLILKQGANRKAYVDHDGETWLFQAAKDNDQVVAELLLEEGIEVETKNKAGETALFVAVWNSQEPSVRILLDHGANPQIALTEGTGQTVLHHATKNAKPSIVKMLLRAGANTEARDLSGCTPLHWDIFWKEQNHQILELLLEWKADTNAQDNEGNTPLHLTVYHRQPQKMQILLDGVSDPTLHTNTRKQNGRTPLHELANNGYDVYSELLQQLLDHGAEIDAQDEDGNTALHHAVINRRYGIMRTLLDSGARVDIRNKGSASPWDVCHLGNQSMEGHYWTEVREILRPHIELGKAQHSFRGEILHRPSGIDCFVSDITLRLDS